MKITHVLKLKGADEFTKVFLNSLEPLQAAGRLGPILFQLAPTHKRDLEALGEFLGCLPKHLRAAFEFRHETWFEDPVYELLRSNNAALCLAENEKLETPRIKTADFTYFRLRKPEYSEHDLEQICAAIGTGDTFAIFKHEDTPDGALHAEKLLRRCRAN